MSYRSFDLAALTHCITLPPPLPYIETATYSSKRDSDILWSFSVIFTRYGVMRVSMLKQALRSGILVIGTVRATVRLNSAVLN